MFYSTLVLCKTTCFDHLGGHHQVYTRMDVVIHKGVHTFGIP